MLAGYIKNSYWNNLIFEEQNCVTQYRESFLIQLHILLYSLEKPLFIVVERAFCMNKVRSFLIEEMDMGVCIWQWSLQVLEQMSLHQTI